MKHLFWPFCLVVMITSCSYVSQGADHLPAYAEGRQARPMDWNRCTPSITTCR